MPLELARTNSWSYSDMNLDGLISLAILGDRAGVDLWRYATPDGRSLRTAILYLVPFALGDQKWSAQQINGFNGATVFPLLRRAAPRYDDAEFRAITARIPPPGPSDRARLLEFAR
jgi:hypothetical protein